MSTDRWLLLVLALAVGVLFYLHFAAEDSPQPVKSTRIEWPSLDTADSRIDCLQRQLQGHESMYTRC